MPDLFAWFRRKGGRGRTAPAAARATIAKPISGPMFSNRVEPMNQQRAPAPSRPDPRARQAGGSQQQSRQGDGNWYPSTHGYLAAHGVERSFVGRKVVKGVSLYVRRG